MTKLKNCPFCGGEAEIYQHPIDEISQILHCINQDCILSDGFGFELRDKGLFLDLWNRRANDWQPIETLPDEIKKDKTRILGYYWDYNEIEIIRWNPTPKGSYPWEAGMYHRYGEDAISHWKPLPTPPQETDDVV